MAIETELGKYDEAVRLHNQALEIVRSYGDQSGIVETLFHLATIQEHGDNYDGAKRIYNDALKISDERYNEAMGVFRILGDLPGIVGTLHQLGRISEKRGNYDDARKLYDQCLEIERKLGESQKHHAI